MGKMFFTLSLSALFMSFILMCDNPKAPMNKQADLPPAPPKPPTEITKAEKLRDDMRKLWEDHVAYTRNVIFCLVDNLPGTDQAVKRLLANQDDIGNAMKQFYGDTAAKKLTVLLHEHITGAAEVVKAAKMNDAKSLDVLNKSWMENADQISVFLSGANPNWKEGEMKMMMHDHLKLTTDEAVARIKKDYEADIKAYDNVHDEILKMADMLSEGIIKQFPDKFK